METLRLLVTELVTNSVRHTECDSLTLRVAIGKAAVLTAVADDGPNFDADAAVEAEQRLGPVPGPAPRPRLGRQEGRPLQAGLVRARPRLERQLGVRPGRAGRWV